MLTIHNIKNVDGLLIGGWIIGDIHITQNLYRFYLKWNDDTVAVFHLSRILDPIHNYYDYWLYYDGKYIDRGCIFADGLKNYTRLFFSIVQRLNKLF